MMQEALAVAYAHHVLCISAYLLFRRRSAGRQRLYWVHPINQVRAKESEFLLYHRLRNFPQKFFDYLRMYPACFDYLLSRLRPRIVRMSNREPISAEHRLVVTLCFLAEGSTFRRLAFRFRLGRSTVADSIKEMCKAIWDEFNEELIRLPQNAEEWKATAADFQRLWNFPHILGAIDGKHVRMKKPAKSGSLFMNYKGYFSTVMMAVCDARYRIRYLDIGSYGHQGDAGIFGSSTLAKAIADGSLNFPDHEPLADGDPAIPYFFVGDGAFPLSERMMKPFPGHNLEQNINIFNFRLSRARRVIENVSECSLHASAF